jgi:hypothetical protein
MNTRIRVSSSRGTRSPIISILFFGLFFVVGAIVLMWGISSSQSAFKSQGWPSVSGWVTDARISSSTSSKGSTTFSAKITYTYTLNGQVYKSSRVSFGDVSTSNSGDAQRIVSRYSTGTTVSVYYNPVDPSQTVLETGFSVGLLLPLGIGTLFTLVGGLLLIFNIVGYLQSSPQSDEDVAPQAKAGTGGF